MWFFKKKMDRPEPPCGDKGEHYSWTDDNWPCPICMGKKVISNEKAQQERFAELIAEKVAAKIQQSKGEL